MLGAAAEQPISLAQQAQAEQAGAEQDQVFKVLRVPRVPLTQAAGAADQIRIQTRKQVPMVVQVS
jgi:hypothetical protein